MKKNRYPIDNAQDLFSALANAPSQGTRIETSEGESLTKSQARKRALPLSDEVEAGTLLLTLVTGWTV